jgi:hypothetical protein
MCAESHMFEYLFHDIRTSDVNTAYLTQETSKAEAMVAT